MYTNTVEIIYLLELMFNNTNKIPTKIIPRYSQYHISENYNLVLGKIGWFDGPDFHMSKKNPLLNNWTNVKRAIISNPLFVEKNEIQNISSYKINVYTIEN